jgi:integrase
MTWAELDWRNAIWTIPGEKMKMGLEHIVPLASQSLEVLEELNQIRRKGDYVFPSARGASRPLSDNGVRTALRSMGYDN